MVVIEWKALDSTCRAGNRWLRLKVAAEAAKRSSPKVKGPIAQLVERAPDKGEVDSSTLSRPTITSAFASA
jgi:hypothetical protein